MFVCRDSERQGSVEKLWNVTSALDLESLLNLLAFAVFHSQGQQAGRHPYCMAD